MSVLDPVLEHVEHHLSNTRRAPITYGERPEAIRDEVRGRYDFSRPQPLETVIDDVASMMWRWSEHATHPKHFGLFRPHVDRASVAADALVAAYDPNMAIYDFCPVAHEIEALVLETIARRFGIAGDESHAHFTSGGQEANHTAVAIALTWKFPEFGRRGVRALTGQPVLYLSQEGHHSFEKVAHATGIGRDALRWIPAGLDLRMDLDALSAQILADRAAGCEPFLVVGTAGTTNAGVIDPLEPLAEIARAEGLWYHIDAAWGGAAALSDKLRPALAGIERADSITCDAHKWLSVPTGAGMFFLRHGELAERTFEVDAAYVPPRRPGALVAPLSTTLQWSRRFIGLKLFMVFAARGLQGVVERIEHQARVGDHLRDALDARGWKRLNDTPLPLSCYTHPHLESGAVTYADVVSEIATRQIAWISKTLLRGSIPALRTCISNYETTVDDVDALLDGLDAVVEELASVSAS